MTLRTAGLAVALGSPLFALYILGVILLLDLDSPPGQYALAMPVAVFLGFVPWGFLLHQMASSASQTGKQPDGIRLRAFVALLDAGKGALAAALGWAATNTPEGTMAAGLAVLTGDVASRLLFRYGRSGGVSVGALLVMAWLPGVIALASVPLAMAGVQRRLPGGLVVAMAVIAAPLVLALANQAEYVYLLFAGPAGAIMLFQYRRVDYHNAADEAIPPIPPANTSPP